MTLGDVKKNALALIEELNTQDNKLTDDEDILNKINRVCNSVQMELAEIRKIEKKQKYIIEEGMKEIIFPNNFFQFKDIVEDIQYSVFANTLILGEEYIGELTLEYYAYPQTITVETEDNHELEIDLDAQNIMHYGIASDILKADISANYTIYEAKYQDEKARLRSYSKYDNIAIYGGIDI